MASDKKSKRARRSIALTAFVFPEDDVFVSECPEASVTTQGDSREHALEMLKDAVGLHVGCLSNKEFAELKRIAREQTQTTFRVTTTVKPRLTTRQREALTDSILNSKNMPKPAPS